MAFQLPPLPYDLEALEPHISKKTLEFHYGKHHQAYITNLNKLLEANPQLANQTLENIISVSANDPAKQGIFNNAAQVWNHTFFWHSMSAQGGGQPHDGSLKTALLDSFSSLEAFHTEFKQAATTQFGSGWAWLVKTSDGKLAVTKTSNANVPWLEDQIPLLTCDVWEHAYYLDYQNRRPDYVDIFLKHLVNWQFAEENFLRH